MKMRILIMMILSILGINSNAMNGPENLTIAQGNQYIVGFFSTSVYVPANHTLEWSCSPWAIFSRMVLFVMWSFIIQDIIR